MDQHVAKTLGQLRNTRDLRAEVVSLAADLVGTHSLGRLTVVDPVISPSKVRSEWERLLAAINPSVRDRMSLDIELRQVSRLAGQSRASAKGTIQVNRPNYRFEVLRLLLGASLARSGADSLKELIERVGSSQTPIREAILDLKRAGIVHSIGRSLQVVPEEISQELLAKVGAVPQTLRFRFERGARLKRPTELVERVSPLLSQTVSKGGWEHFALSGAALALADVPQLDLMGIPRLDLVAQVPRDAKRLDSRLVRQLDDSLELEPSVLVPVPVVVTLVRADTSFFRMVELGTVARCAFPADVFLSLLDMGLRDQALQYAREIHG